MDNSPSVITDLLDDNSQRKANTNVNDPTNDIGGVNYSPEENHDKVKLYSKTTRNCRLID
jgi:hypothetical protein